MSRYFEYTVCSQVENNDLLLCQNPAQSERPCLIKEISSHLELNPVYSPGYKVR